eukprot:GDKJ01054056.1.p1 GENE.GDKJ01054056.1~~GDKJ01054056.1.p1  ORF type:complete len:101 (+),score=11.64 GDKJ01054056.1:7-309(+)
MQREEGTGEVKAEGGHLMRSMGGNLIPFGKVKWCPGRSAWIERGERCCDGWLAIKKEEKPSLVSTSSCWRNGSHCGDVPDGADASTCFVSDGESSQSGKV